jgi:glutathione S-transferase
MRPYKREDENSFNVRLELGYYPVRSKAQIPRLLCEVLHIDYEDHFFTPDEWSRYKESEAREWTIRDLPFLRDGQFVVTGPAAVVVYIAEKAGRGDLMGRTLADKVRIDSLKSKHDIRSAIEGLICAYQEDQGKVAHMFTTRIEPILRDYENDCPNDGWFFSYFTVMDFLVYELPGLVTALFPVAAGKFRKLAGLRDRFAAIP